jgi:hypothetical protein
VALKSGETVGHFVLLVGVGSVDANSFAGGVPNAVCGGKARFSRSSLAAADQRRAISWGFHQLAAQR